MSSSSTQEIVQDLVHDLRQPLGNMETSVLCLQMMLDGQSERIREQLRTMERQLLHAAYLLDRAAADVRALRRQSAGAESLERTNSATAAVT